MRGFKSRHSDQSECQKTLRLFFLHTAKLVRKNPGDIFPRIFYQQLCVQKTDAGQELMGYIVH